eukprot:jgi/Chlat1/8097/Chrsp75S07554
MATAATAAGNWWWGGGASPSGKEWERQSSLMQALLLLLPPAPCPPSPSSAHRRRGRLPQPPAALPGERQLAAGSGLRERRPRRLAHFATTAAASSREKRNNRQATDIGAEDAPSTSIYNPSVAQSPSRDKRYSVYGPSWVGPNHSVPWIGPGHERFEDEDKTGTEPATSISAKTPYSAQSSTTPTTYEHVTHRRASPKLVKKRPLYRRPAWEVRLHELQAFKDRHGHCDVPFNQPNGLGRWLARQRLAWKEGTLEKARYDVLMEAGVTWDVHERQWQRMFLKLAEFHTAAAHANVPMHYVDDPELGKWVVKQRYLYKTGQLPDDRVRRLAGLQFQFRWQWERRIVQLAMYKEQFGDCNVPKNWQHNKALATWVESMRRAYREGDDSWLNESCVRQLNQLGYTALREWKQAAGHLRGPFPPNLGQWVYTQRQLYKAKKMPRDRWRRLNMIGFVWDVEEDTWLRRYRALHELIRTRGFLPVFIALEVHDGLRGLPSPPSSTLIRVSVVDETPHSNLAEQQQQQQQQQHSHVPEGDGGFDTSLASVSDDVDPVLLAKWFRAQRKAALLGQLKPERRDALARLGFSWGRCSLHASSGIVASPDTIANVGTDGVV